MAIKRPAFAIIISLLCVAILSLAGFFYNSYQKEKESASAKIFFDYQIKQLQKNIEDQKLSSLAIAVLLGQNDRVQQCFLDTNRSKCTSNINEIVSNLSSVLMYKNIKIHLHTKDLKSYLRSWDPQNFGDNLSSFRRLLLEIDKTGQPVTGIESGVAGTFIRSVSNITQDGQRLGTIEVILDFEHISNFFKDQGIDIFVLIDKDKTLKKPTDKLLQKYYISNFNSTNLNVVEMLKEFDFENRNFFKHKTHYFAASPLIDANSNRIGHFVLHINKNLKEQNILQEYMILNSIF